MHHGDDIAEGLYNTHVEELLEKTGDNSDDHDELGREFRWILIKLLDDTCVTQSDLQNIDIISKGNEVCTSDTPDSGTIIVNWVQ